MASTLIPQQAQHGRRGGFQRVLLQKEDGLAPMRCRNTHTTRTHIQACLFPVDVPFSWIRRSSSADTNHSKITHSNRIVCCIHRIRPPEAGEAGGGEGYIDSGAGCQARAKRTGIIRAFRMANLARRSTNGNPLLKRESAAAPGTFLQEATVRLYQIG